MRINANSGQGLCCPLAGQVHRKVDCHVIPSPPVPKVWYMDCISLPVLRYYAGVVCQRVPSTLDGPILTGV